MHWGGAQKGTLLLSRGGCPRVTQELCPHRSPHLCGSVSPCPAVPMLLCPHVPVSLCPHIVSPYAHAHVPLVTHCVPMSPCPSCPYGPVPHMAPCPIWPRAPRPCGHLYDPSLRSLFNPIHSMCPHGPTSPRPHVPISHFHVSHVPMSPCLCVPRRRVPMSPHPSIPRHYTPCPCTLASMHPKSLCPTSPHPFVPTSPCPSIPTSTCAHLLISPCPPSAYPHATPPRPLRSVLHFPPLGSSHPAPLRRNPLSTSSLRRASCACAFRSRRSSRWPRMRGARCAPRGGRGAAAPWRSAAGSASGSCNGRRGGWGPRCCCSCRLTSGSSTWCAWTTATPSPGAPTPTPAPPAPPECCSSPRGGSSPAAPCEGTGGDVGRGAGWSVRRNVGMRGAEGCVRGCRPLWG